jgi:hypothetical protein
MELNELCVVDDHEAGKEVRILSPASGKPTDVYITVKGPYSASWRSQKRKQSVAMIRAREEKKLDRLNYDEMDAEALSEVTVSWRGLLKDGEEYAFSKANALSLYKSSPPVVAQLLKVLSDTEGFTKG